MQVGHVAIASLVFCLLANACHGQAGIGLVESTRAIPLTDLPEPPKELDQLIKVGSVSFVSGKKPWGEGTDQAIRIPLLKPGLRVLAETKYELNYDYKSTMRWRIFENGSNRRIRISVSYRKASLKHKHVVWLRNPPSSSTFWTDRIVLHEFDHIRISADAAFSKIFASKLRESSVFTRDIEQNLVVNETTVRKLVNNHVQSVFDEIMQLVAIRYRELDRLTEHGMKAVPSGSPVESWLREASIEPPN